jgi:hypothetical protein
MRRAASVLSLAMTLSLLPLVAAAPAAAATPVPPGANALPTAQIDGVAWQTLVVGSTVYVGGSFAKARPPGAAPGTSTVVRQNLLAFDITTGQLKSGFVANTNGQVLGLAMAPDGSRLYVAGEFTSINGVNRYRVAALNPTTGAVDTTFKAKADFRVRAVLATSDTVYLGGAFGFMNDQPRAQLAAVRRSDGTLLNWAPKATGGQVMALAMVAGSGRIVAGGAFTALNGTAAMGVGALDAATGAVQPFPLNQVIKNGGTSSAIYSLTADATRVYGSGYTFGAEGNFEGNFATDASGKVVWINDIRGDQYDVFATRGMVFTAGHAHQDANLAGGFPQSDETSGSLFKPWHALAQTAAATGKLQPSNNGKFNLGGQPSPTLLHWFPDYTTGTISGANQATWTIAGNSQYIVTGGEFTKVNYVPQQGLTRFAFRDVAASKEPPRLSGPTFLPEVTSPAPGVAQVSFPANWDRDDASLSYSVQREGPGQVNTFSLASSFHSQPVTTFVERNLPVGSQQRYRVVATDGAGLKAIGDWVAVTIAGSGSLGNYHANVLSDRPTLYYRMGGSGAAMTDWAFRNDGVLSSGATRGVPGALAGDSGTAVRLNGSGQNVATAKIASTPRAMSSEVWVRTTSRTGGMLVGWGDRPGTGTSSRVDYVTYLGNDGKVRFGVVENSRSVITSSAAINDGKWHHVVATLDWASGQRLYVDGQLVASNANVKHGRDYRGYWRVGSDSLANWASRPTTDALTGDVDEVATYLTALPASRVAAHYAAGRG